MTDPGAEMKARAQKVYVDWVDDDDDGRSYWEVAAAFAAKEVARANSKVICSFCGTITEYDCTQEHGMVDAVLAHIDGCEKSPVSQLLDANRLIKELESALTRAEANRDFAIQGHDRMRERAETAESALARAVEVMECGHPVSLLIKSTESDYKFCELCDMRDQRNDAVQMEAHYKEQTTRAVEEERAECARAICYACEDPKIYGAVRSRMKNSWRHTNVPCAASAIHERSQLKGEGS